MMTRSARGPFADTTRGQGRVLAMLKIQPDISTKDLSYLLGIRITSLNELLNKLEKSGYITRVPSEADKRVMIIHLTEKGKNAQQTEPDRGDIFTCLTEEEQKTFAGYLDRMIASLEERVKPCVDETEMANWARAARARMGNAQFEHMMSVWKGGVKDVCDAFQQGEMPNGPPFGGRRPSSPKGHMGFQFEGGGFPNAPNDDEEDV